ncbi:MAG: Eco57I restriction-modification methylase domain-containing protein [Candidatus Moraniibacteriota bacterium]
MKIQNNYNPDVLSCLANLSSDEVFTPPKLANEILDLLPKEIWKDKNATFLDPVSKSGVFLREIAKRLLEGLQDEIPNIQKRIDHIYTKQIFGIGITEMTSLLSRRSVYCSKEANGKYSISDSFNDNHGNIFFDNTNHDWKNGRCSYCGASQSEYEREEGLETHAYQFIHNNLPNKIKNMKFDVIIGNPPYQMSFGIEGANSSNAKSIYNLFITQAIKLNPRYLTMITPSRWMTKTSQGIPDEWVENILKSNKFKIVHDFENSSDCFPGVSIMGGVNYFLWGNDYIGKCDYYFHSNGNKNVSHRHDYLDSVQSGIIIRDPKSYGIIDKIIKKDGQYFNETNNNFSSLVSPKHFFDRGVLLTSNWKDFKNKRQGDYNIKYYVNKNSYNMDFGWISKKQIPKNIETKNLNKVYIPAANGSRDIILGKPFYGEPNSICSQTYLIIGYNPQNHIFSKQECMNIISYIKTRFFRYLVSIKKKTQNGPRGVYQFVPLQDFNQLWTDEKLYKKYELTKEEIEFIESMIRPMN